MQQSTIEPVQLTEDGSAVRIVDQTLLPGRLETIELTDRDTMWDAIYKLKVRGAPAIGVAAAHCYYVLARQAAQNTPDAQTYFEQLSQNAQHLVSARPTAVNLPWAIQRMENVAQALKGTNPLDTLAVLEAEARAIHQQAVEASNEIARLGATLLQDGWGVLTHCNAGPLAAMGYGTGLGPILYAHDHGMRVHAYVDETRPLLQGARLTSYELVHAGIETTLICDNMASIVMKEGRVQACMVGCDRVAANGDVANKIGTSGVAILAKHYGIPFYVLGPTSTIDLSCPTGAHIPIEERDGAEVSTMFFEQPSAPAHVQYYNPAFDVTDHSLVSALVTERGICTPPYDCSIAALFNE